MMKPRPPSAANSSKVNKRRNTNMATSASNTAATTKASTLTRRPQSAVKKTKTVTQPELNEKHLVEGVTPQQNEAAQLQHILAYYRARVEAHEQDRRSWYDKLETLRIKQNLVHKIEWELKKRTDEKGEL